MDGVEKFVVAVTGRVAAQLNVWVEQGNHGRLMGMEKDRWCSC
jgi:hypothetical protein